MAGRRNEIRLEHLLGRKVYDQSGRVVGRLEEFRAAREGEHWIVADYRIGTAALLQRLSIGGIGILKRGRAEGYRARWDQLSVDDPDRPTLTVAISELERLHR